MPRGPVAEVNPTLVDGLPDDEKGGGAKSPYVDHLATLRDQPGSWFQMSEFAKRQSAHIRMRDLNERHGENGFEFAVRTVGGKTFLYGRHAGSQPTEGTAAKKK